jgi:hypothetical protein
MVEQKRYAIPYNPDTQAWDPVEVKARIINTGDQKAQNLKDKILVEDAGNSRYAAINNNVLIVDRIDKLQKIEAGDQANITLQLNDSDPGIKDVLKRNSLFNLKVTLYPDPDGKNEPPTADSPSAEGFTEVYVQQPLKWELTFKKAFWDSSKVIDLSKQEGVDKDQLMELGSWGGKLIIKPVGVFQPNDGTAKIVGDQTIEDAQQCTLDIGDGKIVKGYWNKWYFHYEFEIPQAQPDSMGVSVSDLEVPCHIEMLPGYAKFFQEIIKYTKNLQKDLGTDTLSKGREYINGYLNFIAEEKEASLVERREDIRTWVINIPALLYSIKYSTIVYFRALNLFDEGYGRFVENMVNGFVEFVFWVFDFVFKKLKSFAKRGEEVFADVAQDAVETAARETTQELAKQKSFLESTLEALQMQAKKLDDQMDDLGQQLLKASDEQRGDIIRQMNRVIGENNQVLAEVTKQTKEIADLNINQQIVEYAKAHSKEVTEDGFMEGMEAYIKSQGGAPSPEARKFMEQIKDFGGMRMGNITKLENDVLRRLPTSSGPDKHQLEQIWVSIQQYKDYAQKSMLWDFPMSETQNQLMKGPLSQRLQNVRDTVVEMEKSYEKQRYKSVPRIYYEPGIMGSVWHAMDRAIESLAWFYDYVVEGLKKLAGLIGYAVDVVLHYINAIIDWIIKITDTHAYTRTWIKESYRPGGMVSVKGKAGGDFFEFPRTLIQVFANKCRPDPVINQAGSGGQANLNATKQRYTSEAKAQLKAEKTKQKTMANRFFMQIFNEALDPLHFHLPAASSHVRTPQIKAPFQSILSLIQEYEDAFITAGSKGTDGIVKLSNRCGTNFTYQDLDTAIEWLSWSFSWLIRLGSLLLVFTGAGAISIPAWWGYAEIMDRVSAALRPVVSWVGTMPTVIGLQNDAIILSALMYEATVHGTVSLEEQNILTL